ncbi:hypothetical protein PIB30_027177 [Stylosanthes scabra]|uniref:Uncharacterized protein n=1 Tax=Stylosanthes scabra TaxID=79078 RepID=A0ABU6RAT3_9FABA|nr:hypothetical protein [Stylosanthes scabra]
MEHVCLMPRPDSITCLPIRACNSTSQRRTHSHPFPITSTIAHYLREVWSELPVTASAPLPGLLTPSAQLHYSPPPQQLHYYPPSQIPHYSPSRQHIVTNVAQPQLHA